MYILDFKINSRGWARIEIYVEKHKRLKKYITERKSTWKITKELKHPI